MAERNHGELMFRAIALNTPRNRRVTLRRWSHLTALLMGNLSRIGDMGMKKKN